MPSTTTTNSIGANVTGLADIVYPGVNTPILIPNTTYPSLGGGIKGFVARTTNDTNNSDEYVQTRFTLRHAWNTNYQRDLKNTKRIITPFRAVNNAGDILSRNYYSCGGSCQSYQSRPNMKGLKQRFGSIQSVCDASQIEPAACNGRYVYDSSDYITYLKQKAANKTYNDISFGSDSSNSSQVILKSSKR
jgi:hypothetical protein